MDVEEGDLSSVVFARLSGRSQPAASPIARMDLPYPLPAPLHNTAAAAVTAAAVFQSLSLPSTANIIAASSMPFSPCRTSSQLPIPPHRIPLLPPPDFVNCSAAPSSYSYGVNSSSYPFFAAPKAYNYKERGLVDTMTSVNQVLPRVIKEKADLTNISTSGFGIEESPMVLSSSSQSNTNHPSTSKRNPFISHNKKSQGSIPKRRKEQQKRIVCVPSCGSGRPTGEFLPSDMWSWRKYGQKPIKGSPYPRSYYRCSSSKGCPARKQVERSRSDSSMLLITYMAEHNHPWPAHRNALAAAAAVGSSSSKLPNPPQNDAAERNISDHSGANPGTHLGTAEEEGGLPYENDIDDAADTAIDNNNCNSNNSNNNIEMELQMLKYATEHLWGDDDDLFTDLDAGFPPR